MVRPLLCLALLAGAAPALAQGTPRAAVIRIEYDGRVPEVSKVKLAERLLSGLAAAGFAVSAGESVRNALQKAPNPETCRAEACYRDIGARLGLDYLVVASVVVRGKTYDVKLELIGGRDGRARGQESARCELCGIEEVGEKLDGLAASLTGHVDPPASQPARLTVQSQPPGASVKIDGRDAGTTPTTVEVGAGDHEVEVTAAGHTSARKSIAVQAGVSEIVSVALVPLAGPAAPAPAQTGPWRLVGWTGLAVGVAAAAVGAFVLTLDGRDVECPRERLAAEPMAQCRQNTRLAAGLLLGAGGATVAMSGLVLYFGSGRPPAAAVALPTGTARPPF